MRSAEGQVLNSYHRFLVFYVMSKKQLSTVLTDISRSGLSLDIQSQYPV